MTAGVGGSTKKFAFGAAYQLGYAVGNIIGPQTYRGQDAPNYYVSPETRIFGRCAILIGVVRSHSPPNIPCLRS
jgi:MFS transporter, ACS family, allantoate permease